MSILSHQLGFKRFLGVAFLSFIFIYAVVWLLVIEEPLVCFDDWNYPMWLAKMTLVKEPWPGEVTILGDSPASADLFPQRLGPNVVNLALGASTSIEALHFAREAIAGPSLPKAAILSLSPRHFVSQQEFWSYAAGFGLLNWNEIEEARRRSRILKDTSLFGNGSPGDLDARLKAFLYAIKFPSFYFASVAHANMYRSYRTNEMELKFVLANRGYAFFGLADGSTSPDDETGLKTFVPSPILDDYFNQILALFQSRNIPVYFLSMPHNEASVRLYYPGLKEAFTDYLDQYARRYPNFHVLGDPLPSYPSEYFGDAWHLNKKGALKWSDHVAQLLNDSHVEGGPFGPDQGGLSK